MEHPPNPRRLSLPVIGTDVGFRRCRSRGLLLGSWTSSVCYRVRSLPGNLFLGRLSWGRNDHRARADAWPLSQECLHAWEARQMSVPGRKTDVRDCGWIAQLLECALPKANFVPPKPVRDLTRFRKIFIRERGRQCRSAPSRQRCPAKWQK
jgi:hypothetical protein